MTLQLIGKLALVTGAGRGIGKGIAIALAEAGADVVVNYRSSADEALQVAERIRAMGRRSVAIRADVSSTAEIASMMGRVHEEMGTVDILINNSAIDPMKPFLDVTEEFYDSVLNTNLKGTFFVAQACAKDMAAKGGGKIVNISSVHGSTTMPQYSAYAASKGGMNALTRQLALDLAPYNIQVNAVAPGATEVEKFTENPLHDKEEIGRWIPLGRIAYPEDIAKVVVFYASGGSDFVTGQLVTVDGGSSARFYLKG